MLRIFLLLCAGLLLARSTGAQTKMINFDNDALGKPPAGFSFGLTGKGKPGVWVVRKDDASPDHGNVLAQTDADPTGYRFPLCVYDTITAKDVDVSVKFKAISGKGDQGAGIVWRYRDQDNYYIVRANALESNVVLYKVEDGKRTDLPLKGEGRTYGKKERLRPGRGARYESSQPATASKSTTMAGSCMRWKTRRSKTEVKSAFGQKRIR
jgi:hypothetical protein